MKRGKKLSFSLLCFVIIFSLAIPISSPAEASPATIYVDDDRADYPAADFTRIQDTVDAASPSDTIIVYLGTYTENVDVKKHDLTIKSQNGADSTTVEAAADSPVFSVSGRHVNINGFSVKGATHHGGIWLFYADYCNISNNDCSSNEGGIELESSNNNTLMNNNVHGNRIYGIYLDCTEYDNLISNIVYDNTCWGIGIKGSNETLTGNRMENNGIEIRSGGSWNTHTIGTDNNVNGKPVYYWKNVNGGTIPPGAGQVILANCTNVEVSNQNVSHASVGIQLGFSSDCIIINNTANSNSYGIYLNSSSNNYIHLNNFVDNIKNAYSYNSTNTWNSPEEITYTYNGKTYTSYLGNYWDDYTGSDAGGDGIGDTPYSIDSEADNYPLTEPFENYEISVSPWPMFQHDPQHTGRSPYLGPQTDNVKWTYDFDAQLHSCVVGPRGTVHANSDTGLYAINSNGTLRWVYNAPALRPVPAIASDGTIYIIWRDGVSALTPEGELKWFYALEKPNLSANPLVRSDGSVLVTTLKPVTDGTAHLVLLALANDGTLLWMFDTGFEQPTNSSLVVDQDGNIYFGVGATLFALDSGGSLNWSKVLGGKEVGTPSIGSNGTIYVVTSGGLEDAEGIYGISSDGSILWKYWHWGYGGSVCSQAIGSDGTVYIALSHAAWPGMSYGFLEALDASGNLRWEVGLASQPYVYYSSAVVGGDGTIYVVGYVNSVRALNPDGTVKWSATYANVHAHSTSLSLGSDGTLYLVGDQKLYALGPLGDITPPAAVTDLTATEGTTDSISLIWTAPGDDGTAGTATTYDIRYCTSEITDANWDSATQCTGERGEICSANSEEKNKERR